MNVCIVGGGLTGLVAAYRLSSHAHVDLLEADGIIGGCLSSSPAGEECIEDFYHHCFSGDKQLLSLFGELGLDGEIEWLRGSTANLSGGEIHPLTSLSQILRYRDLTLRDKVRIGMLTLRASGYDREALDSVSAREFIIRTCGEHAYESFFEPLMRSKFGDRRDSVSAAWIVSRIAIRSDRGKGGERLGYPKHGFYCLTDGLKNAIEARGGRIHTGIPARSLTRTGKGWEVNGAPYDAVISTISPGALAAIGGPDMGEIPYQGAACMTLGLSRDVCGGIYWINLRDEAPYGAVIGHTNMVPKERYGCHVVYIASYYTGDLPDDTENRMCEDFCTRFGVDKSEILWHRLKVAKDAGPVYVTGYKEKIPPYEYDGLYLAGMFSLPNYPERSMEGSVAAGEDVAARLLQEAPAP